jgi:hypothetical protein
LVYSYMGGWVEHGITVVDKQTLTLSAESAP